MNTDPVLLEKTGHVATVTLNRPETLNALAYDTVVSLGAVVDDVGRDPGVRAIVLTGAGRGFCSGANLLGGTGQALGGGGMGVRAAIMDMNAFNLGFMTLSSTRASFVLPLICFVVIAAFGFRTSKVHGHTY